MNNYEALIHKFYTAFSEKDAEKMADCYHSDVIFSDPAFGVLKGEQVSNMWRMLCYSQKDKEFKVTYKNVQSSGNIVMADWEAFYEFGPTGRKVHNKIHAQFELKEGLIIKHTDKFNLHAWASQALGFKGWIVGGTSFFRKKLNRQTHKTLNQFERKQNVQRKTKN